MMRLPKQYINLSRVQLSRTIINRHVHHQRFGFATATISAKPEAISTDGQTGAANDDAQEKAQAQGIRGKKILKRAVIVGGTLISIGFAMCDAASMMQDENVSWAQKCSLFLGLSQAERKARKEKERQMVEALNHLRQSGKLTKEKVDQLYYQILYGDECDPDYLRAKMQRYGNVAWTDELLEFIRDLKIPIVEVGAGAGQWSSELRDQYGVDIVATDVNPTWENPGSQKASDAVEALDAVAAVKKYEDRVLMAVYPPMSDMMTRVLDAYTGDVVIYVGEGDGGLNGDAAFFQRLERDFTLFKVIEVHTEDDPSLAYLWADSFEKAYFLRRKKTDEEAAPEA